MTFTACVFAQMPLTLDNNIINPKKLSVMLSCGSVPPSRGPQLYDNAQHCPACCFGDCGPRSASGCLRIWLATHPSLLSSSRPNSGPESDMQLRCLGAGGGHYRWWAWARHGHGKGKEHDAMCSSVISCMGTKGPATSELVLSFSWRHSLESHIRNEAKCRHCAMFLPRA